MAKDGIPRIVDPRLSDAAVFCCGATILAVISVRSIISDDRFGSLHNWLLTVFVAVGLLVSFFMITAGRGHPLRGLGTFPWLGLLAVAAIFFWPVLQLPTLTLSIIGIFCSIKYLWSVRLAGKKTWNPIRPVLSLASIAISLCLAGFAVVGAGEGWLFDSLGFDLIPWYGYFSLAFTLAAWVRLLRPAVEWFFVVGFGIMYRQRGFGPGIDEFPQVGPVLVIANHAAYMDPPVLERVLPRPVTALMTSIHYDKWFLKPMAKWVFRCIRVPDVLIRREAPELHDAIAALDRGECVLIFPESWLRRKDDIPLKRFAKGVWQILSQRPHTPVVSCWIEGTWGSYFSHKDGPPTVGKRFDLRRLIRVGVNSPRPVPPELLIDHWDTRFYCMNEVSNARVHLGMEPLPHFERQSTDTDT